MSDLFSHPHLERLKSKKKWFLLGIVLGLSVFFFFWAHSGYNFSDDFKYAKLANDISQDQFVLTRHTFENRLGVTVPTALSYLLFGVNRYSVTLWPFLCSLMAIGCVFVALERYVGVKTAFIASFLLAVNPLQIAYASRLFPDLIMSTWMLFSVVALDWGRRSNSAKQARNYGIACASCFWIAFVAKMGAVWVLPFLTVVAARDVLRRKHLTLWCWIVGTGLGLGVLFLATYFYVTGDPLYRIHGIKEAHNLTQWSFHDRTAMEYFRRLTYMPILGLFERTSYGILFCLSLPGLVVFFRKRADKSSEIQLWVGYFLVLFFMIWFGTTSPSSYNPLPVNERFWHPLLAPLAILAGWGVVRAFSGASDGKDFRSGSALLIAGGFLTATGVSLISNARVEITLLYGSLFLLFLVAWGVERFRLMNPTVSTKVLYVAFFGGIAGSACDGSLFGRIGRISISEGRTENC